MGITCMIETRCKHIGTRPPAGIGSLRDCGVVHLGKIAEQCTTKHCLLHDNDKCAEIMMTHCSCMLRSMLWKIRMKASVDITRMAWTDLCTSHRSSSPLLLHMCLGNQKCNLGNTNMRALIKPLSTYPTAHHRVSHICDYKVCHCYRIQDRAKTIVALHNKMHKQLDFAAHFQSESSCYHRRTR